MKTQSIKKVTVIAMAAALLALNSCQKEKTKVETATTGNELSSDKVYKEVQLVMNSLSNTGSFKTDGLPLQDQVPACATVTNDTISKPHVYTVDYGTGCVGFDGQLRSGKITLKYNSTNMHQINNQWVATPKSFVVGGEAISGTVTIKNTGFNSNGNLVYSVVETVTDVTSKNQTYTINQNMNYESIAGANTSNTSDDVYSITGTTSGKNQGTPYTLTITSPLINSNPCNNYTVQGTMVYRLQGSPDKTYDYGNGSCTTTVSITQNGNTVIQQQ
ncbi:MAG: hypothetical protein JWO06_3073 [Bacteroidota bacterium]|nr:hypothetical protein [Bacteroidota bacterium]